jgi:hypothetical protein
VRDISTSCVIFDFEACQNVEVKLARDFQQCILINPFYIQSWLWFSPIYQGTHLFFFFFKEFWPFYLIHALENTHTIFSSPCRQVFIFSSGIHAMIRKNWPFPLVLDNPAFVLPFSLLGTAGTIVALVFGYKQLQYSRLAYRRGRSSHFTSHSSTSDCKFALRYLSKTSRANYYLLQITLISRAHCNPSRAMTF